MIGLGDRLFDGRNFFIGILGDIFDIITGEVDSEEDTLKQVYQSCFQLLMAMARSNPVVQNRLFDRLGTFLKISNVGDYLAELFVEIFSGNRDLCLKIPPPLITEVVQMLAKTQSPTLIRLLCSLVMIESSPLKRNQSLVVKALLQYKQSIEAVTDTTQEMRMKLLKSDERKIGTLDKKRYFCNIVQLLSYCSQGDNKAVESICQSMFTLPELLDIILLPQLCNGLRGPFVQFLVSVFFTSDLESDFEMKELAHEPKLWTYIDNLCAELKEITSQVLDDPVFAKNLLKWRPTKVHLNKHDKEHELKESLHYVFDGVLPFLNVFYKQFYQREMDMEDDSVSMSTNVDSNIIDIHAQAEAERHISHQFLNQSLIPFAINCFASLVKEEQVMQLTQTIQIIQTALGLSTDLPPELLRKLPENSEDPMVQYREYYKDEQKINMMLCSFASNLREAYGGPNTVEAQLGVPINRKYTLMEGDEALPLGIEFQHLVGAFIDSEKEDPLEKYTNIATVIGQVRDALTYQKGSEREKIRLEELTRRSLQVLRTVLHNEIIKVPDETTGKQSDIAEQEDVVAEAQEALIEMGILEAILNHITSPSENVSREVLALLTALLYGGNEKVQKRFMVIWLSSREEPFFSSIKARMTQTEEILRERRILMNQSREVCKGFKGEKSKLSKMNSPEDLFDIIEKGQNVSGEKGKKKSLGSIIVGAFTRSKNKKHSIEEEVKTFEERMKRKKSYQHRHDCRDATFVPLSEEDQAVVNAGRSFLGGLIQDVSTEMIRDLTVQGAKSAVNEDLRQQSDADFKDTGHLNLVLKVLAGLCDGQNTDIQNYLRDQYDNLKNIDIVGESANFMSLLYSSVNSSSIGLVTQLMDSLIEMVQGNEANQVVVFDRKIIDYINHMLRMDELPDCNREEIFTFKRAIGILLTDMTEENSPSGHTKMIMEAINKEEIATVMEESYALVR